MIKVMAANHCELYIWILLCQGLVLPVVEYSLAILMLSKMQFKKLDKIQERGNVHHLGCTRVSTMKAMKFMLDHASMLNRV